MKNRKSNLKKIVFYIIGIVLIGISIFYVEKMTDKSPKVDIGLFDYKILSSEFVNIDNDNAKFIFDILVNKNLSDEELLKFEQELYDDIKEKINKKLVNVIIHIFNSDKNYNTIKSEGYNHHEDLTVTILADHKNNPPVIEKIQHYPISIPKLEKIEISKDEDPYEKLSGDIDALEYEVYQAEIINNHAIIDILISGEVQYIPKFIIGFIQVMSNMHEDIEKFTLNLYDNPDSLENEDRLPKWKYENNLITVREIIDTNYEVILDKESNSTINDDKTDVEIENVEENNE